nr:unnamed protein product [Digitaria exilis]
MTSVKKSLPAAIQRFASLTVRASLNATSWVSQKQRIIPGKGCAAGLRNTEDLNVVLVLIRPQPRRVVIAGGIGIEHRLCRGNRLILGKGPRLNAQPIVMVLGHITGSINKRIRRSPLSVHHDPAFSLQTRITCKLEIEINTDPDDHGIKGFTLAVTVNDRQTIVIFQLQRSAAGADIHALFAVKCFQLLRYLGAHRTHAQRGLLLKQRHGDATFTRGGRNLQANPASADNRQVLTLCQARLQPLCVLPVAQGIDLRVGRPCIARQTRPTTEIPRAPAGTMSGSMPVAPLQERDAVAAPPQNHHRHPLPNLTQRHHSPSLEVLAAVAASSTSTPVSPSPSPCRLPGPHRELAVAPASSTSAPRKLAVVNLVPYELTVVSVSASSALSPASSPPSPRPRRRRCVIHLGPCELAAVRRVVHLAPRELAASASSLRSAPTPAGLVSFDGIDVLRVAHKPQDYSDVRGEYAPAVYSALERHLPPSLLDADRDVKLQFMRDILARYWPQGERNKVPPGWHIEWVPSSAEEREE